jgi:cobalt/nickel transport system permease protein
MAVVGPFVAYGIFKLLRKNNVNAGVSVFAAAALGDLATYVVTSLQLGVAFPDPVGGIAVSIFKFLSIFALTQIPIAAAEGIITALVYDKVVEYEGKDVINENFN